MNHVPPPPMIPRKRAVMLNISPNTAAAMQSIMQVPLPTRPRNIPSPLRDSDARLGFVLRQRYNRLTTPQGTDSSAPIQSRIATAFELPDTFTVAATSCWHDDEKHENAFSNVYGRP